MRSQIGQDLWVCETLNYKKNGYFLDIGAFDGVEISNTYYLETKLGWSGVCVEAGEENFDTLINNRNCECVQFALNDEMSVVRFKENWTVGKIAYDGDGILTTGVDFPYLLSFCNCPKVIDYISLDIEGMEYRALTKFPFKDYKARLWTIEHNAHEDGGEMKRQIQELMTKNGYSVAKELGFEDWYAYDNINKL